MGLLFEKKGSESYESFIYISGSAGLCQEKCGDDYRNAGSTDYLLFGAAGQRISGIF